MGIVFHDESFPDSLSDLNIYEFSNHLKDLYTKLQKIISKDRCFVSTADCKRNGANILNELFNSQRKISGTIDVSLISVINRLIDTKVVSIDEEAFIDCINKCNAVVTNGYRDDLQSDIVSLKNKCLKNITNVEQFEKHKYFLPIAIYEPNPKHRLTQGNLEGKGVISPMDLDDTVAQDVLNSSISAGKKRYGCYKGRYYEFQRHRGNCWHGYCPHDGLPEHIEKQLKEAQNA